MKKVLLIVVGLLVLIQFIRPAKNSSNDETNGIRTVVSVPNEINDILLKSCFDCHSNKTEYPWYSNIAPVSWYLASHVNEGKEHLNFSEWAKYNENQKDHILSDLKEELESKGMPLTSYTMIHKNAQLSSEEYAKLLNWVKTLKAN